MVADTNLAYMARGMVQSPPDIIFYLAHQAELGHLRVLAFVTIPVIQINGGPFTERVNNCNKSFAIVVATAVIRPRAIVGPLAVSLSVAVVPMTSTALVLSRAASLAWITVACGVMASSVLEVVADATSAW